MVEIVKWCLFVIVIGFLVNHFFLAEPSPRENAIAIVVDEINEMKGEMVDDITMLKGAYETSGGMVIAYQLLELNTPFGFDDEAKQKINRMIKSKGCSLKPVRKLLDLDIRVTVQFFDPANKKITQESVDNSSCR